MIYRNSDGSAFEVESQLYICKELEHLGEEKLLSAFAELEIIQKQLNTLYTKIRK